MMTWKYKISTAAIILIFLSPSIPSAGTTKGPPPSAGTTKGSPPSTETTKGSPLSAGIAVGSPYSAGTIVGSPHDFRGYLWNRSGEICSPCHAPHSTKILPAPLWDQELSTQTYTMYSKTHSPTMDIKISSQPDGISKKCLSCHDGIIGPESYGGNTGGIAYRFDKDYMGTIPNNNHPISFTYDTALATKDGDLYDPSTRPSGLTGSTGTVKEDMLFSNRMECASCHDAHNTKAVPGTKLLVKDPAGSALCLTCHNK